MANSISQAQDALLQLGRKADASTKKHLATISSALESLGKRVNELERLAKQD
jgi:hypothetical protein